MTVMLYKSPGPHKLHGVMVDYVIVDEADVEAKLAEGWFKTTLEADAGQSAEEEKQEIEEDETRPPSREELEAQANELGLKFRSDIKDDTLLERINEALEG